MAKILITGSNGTIGTQLSQKLLDKGYEVIGVDWKKNKWNKEVDKATINIDLRDKKSILDKLPKDIDLIIHLAANPYVFNSVVDPKLAKDNFDTIFNILEFARQNNIKNFIFSSSREAYGNTGEALHAEDDALIPNCESPYAATKIAGEALVHSYQRCYDINSIIFRFSNVYGMYDERMHTKWDRVIPLFIDKCKDGETLSIYGKDKLLDFTYIDDCVDGVVSGIEKLLNLEKNISYREVFNIAYGGGNSILKLAELIKENTKSTNEIKVEEVRTGEVVQYIADISKAKKELKYSPKTNLEEGIKKTVKWYNKNIYKNN